ncbi:putative SNAP [Penguinpox virus]|uniref:Putative SNAP n=1 Tax=Penguinpox virus TaxID=648998 RepID=A0A068EEP9_9POXV|nr:putative SNAP [Penguinpox virus]AID46779.1 putative SNAP [Penguinpox virus]
MEKEAYKLLSEADRKLKGIGFLFSWKFLRNMNNIKEVGNLLIRSAILFKAIKNWELAGYSFLKAAVLQSQESDFVLDTAINFVNASNMYIKIDPKKAIQCLLQAIEVYKSINNFITAAKHQMTVAEIYESRIMDLEKACIHYEHATEYYREEGSVKLANDCMIKVADCFIQMKQFDKAASMYEQIGIICMGLPILKHRIKDQFLKAILCHFCIGDRDIRLIVRYYTELYAQFTDYREYKLIMKVVESHDKYNLDILVDALKEYDSVTRLDSSLTIMILEIKKNIQTRWYNK